MKDHRESYRWGGWHGAALLAVGVVLILILARVSYVWHQHYQQTVLALAAIESARQTASPVLERHLLGMARSLLGAPHRAGSAQLTQAAIDRLHGLEMSQWVVSPAVWGIVFVVLVVGIYWLREGRIAALEMEHRMLKEQLLAIERGWASLAANSNPREVMQHILSEVAQHTAVQSAAIYQLTDSRTNSLNLYASFGSLMLSEDPIPRLFVTPSSGLIGEAMADNAPRYSGDQGEIGYLIPGVRRRQIGVFPLRYGNATWGVLLLSSPESNWYYTYRDLLEVLAQEIAIAAATSELAEQARRHQLMEERARLQSEILANVSHELRTPLGLVKGYLETLQKSWERMPDEERQEFLDVAAAETEELEELIDHLLMMSRVESAEMPFKPERFLLDPWFHGILERYAWWDQKRISVSQTPDPNVWVYGDPRELTTALSDLLQNALKYSHDRIDVQFRRATSDWSVTVRDWGPGVPVGEMTKIFERFYRVPAQAQSEVRGSGLGLSIVKRIVESHHGQVQAANAPGGGFQVTMRLPLDAGHEKQRAGKGGWSEHG